MLDKEITRRKFIKSSAIGVAATTLTPTILTSGSVFGLDSNGQPKMFCYQCEQTSKGTGCTVMGICGKTPEVASLHDLLIYTLRGLSVCALAAREKGIESEDTSPDELRYAPISI